jgi:hypothetical protein
MLLALSRAHELLGTSDPFFWTSGFYYELHRAPEEAPRDYSRATKPMGDSQGGRFPWALQPVNTPIGNSLTKVPKLCTHGGNRWTIHIANVASLLPDCDFANTLAHCPGTAKKRPNPGPDYYRVLLLTVYSTMTVTFPPENSQKWRVTMRSDNSTVVFVHTLLCSVFVVWTESTRKPTRNYGW